MNVKNELFLSEVNFYVFFFFIRSTAKTKPYKLQTLELDVSRTVALPSDVNSRHAHWCDDPRARRYGTSTVRPDDDSQKGITLTAFTRLIPLSADDRLDSLLGANNSVNAAYTVPINLTAAQADERKPINSAGCSSSPADPSDSIRDSGLLYRATNATDASVTSNATRDDDVSADASSAPHANVDATSSRASASNDGATSVQSTVVTVARHIMHHSVNWMSSTRTVLRQKPPPPANGSSVK
jgi:hypothetical protein